MEIQASAPGKVILCGEHAVVYGQPALALPLPDVRAVATVRAASAGSGLVLEAPDIGAQWQVADDPTQPLATLAQLTLSACAVDRPPDCRVTLRSAIPIASGMGSGAALGAALVRALARYLGTQLGPAEVSQLVFESERAFHGTPSGIDNTVVSYERAIHFVRATNGAAAAPTIEPIVIGRPFTLMIGDTGVRAPTHVTVGGVRERFLREPERYTRLFRAIGQCVNEVQVALAAGDIARVGRGLDANQALLADLGVSSPELERLIAAARDAGALGAKLSGGGGGGIMLAVVEDRRRADLLAALRLAGASRIVETVVR